VIAYSQKYGELIMAEEELANANLLRINFDLEESSESEMSFKRLLKRGYDLMTSGDADYKSVKIDNEALAAILFTSGTTGMTKGVMLSHKNICSNIMSICKMINVNPDEQFLSILPLHHTYECTIGFLLPLYRGLCISFCRGIRYIAKDILEVRPTVLILVPIIIEGIHDKIIAKTQETSKDARKYKIGMAAATSLLKVGIDIRKKVFKPISAVFGGRLRLLISGASAIKPEVVRDFHMFGLEIHQGYGLTECSPLVAGNADGLITFDTVGTAVPEVEIDIVNKDEKGIGEIICSGPNIMLGYYKNKEQTDKVMIDGWFHTGDLGMYVMEKKQQCLKIAGRLKNVIITKNGENIYPEEVEYYLLSSPIISEAVVFGEEGKNDVVLKAEVYPNFDELAKEMNIDRQNITADQIKNKIGEVIKKINEKMPTYKIIRGFDIRENEFIKTTTQKIIREYKNKKQDK
jgi:long-chain acyl-CoA synthetase